MDRVEFAPVQLSTNQSFSIWDALCRLALLFPLEHESLPTDCLPSSSSFSSGSFSSGSTLSNTAFPNTTFPNTED